MESLDKLNLCLLLNFTQSGTCVLTFRIILEYFTLSSDTSKLQEIVNLPRPVVCCLAALINYLRDFNLEKVLCQLE